VERHTGPRFSPLHWPTVHQGNKCCLPILTAPTPFAFLSNGGVNERLVNRGEVGVRWGAMRGLKPMLAVGFEGTSGVTWSRAAP
jgi:hypothetical protein